MIPGLLLLFAHVAHSEVVVVGGEDGYKPYETLDQEGQPEGFHVDLMRAIARESGFEVRFELGDWETMRVGLAHGEIDVLGMFVSAERANDVAFAQPHVIVHHRIFVPASAPSFRSVEELAGKRVIVQRAALSHEYLQETGLDIELTLVDTDTEGLRLLADNEHDAALLTEHRGRFALRHHDLKELTVSGPPVLPVEYAFAVQSDNDALLQALNQGLERVMASGEFDRIHQRWLQPYERPGGTPALLVAIIAALIVILLALGAWQLARSLRVRREVSQRLDYLESHDALTGLLNRLAFEKRLSQFLIERPKNGQNVLLGINIDQFRLINDNLGHTTGDRVLVALASLIQEVFGRDVLAARLGSDEFAVLLDRTGEQDAVVQGQRFLDKLRRIEPQPGGTVGASIGLYSFSDEDLNVAQILRRVDCAGLAAKEDGGHRVHCWHSKDRRLAERVGMLRWVGRIQSALHEGRMEAHYQPIAHASSHDGALHAVEVLIRMRTRDGELLPAGQFMPAAERYSLSPDIDRWMLTHVLEFLADHPVVGQCVERVNINLSGRSLGDDRFLRFLLSTMDAADDELINQMCFEITETALIANLSRARKVLEQLHERGCRFALDDFGSGLSSMAYLKALPVDYLKIDGGFVRDIDRDESARQMVAEINRLGQAVGKRTIAEYVESSAIMDRLTELGVDLLQGYAIGRPAPLEQLLAWCEESGTRNVVNRT